MEERKREKKKRRKNRREEEEQEEIIRGLLERLSALSFDKLSDPRQVKKVTYPVDVLMKLLTLSLSLGAQSRREGERICEGLDKEIGKKLGLKGEDTPADNTLGDLLPRLLFSEVVELLVEAVFLEKNKGNLEPLYGMNVAAIDGKKIVTLHWLDLCRLAGVEPCEADPQKVVSKVKAKYPQLQVCQNEDNEPYAVLKVHDVTLVSSRASVPIYVRPIQGDTNEIGSMPALLEEVYKYYGKRGLIDVIVADAGNCSNRVAQQIVNGYGWHYMLRIKENQPELLQEAIKQLGSKPLTKESCQEIDVHGGQIVTYYVFVYDLQGEGWLAWKTARQLVRIVRVAESKTTGKISKGERYFVSDLAPDKYGPSWMGKFARSYWRCENETHFVADTAFGEDVPKPQWTKNPTGLLVVAILRKIAMIFIAILRHIVQLGRDDQFATYRGLMDELSKLLCHCILRYYQRATLNW